MSSVVSVELWSFHRSTMSYVMSWQHTMWFIFSNSVLSHHSQTIFIIFFFFFYRDENPTGDFMRVAWSPLLIVVVSMLCDCREVWMGFTVWKMVTELEKKLLYREQLLVLDAIMGYGVRKRVCSICIIHSKREDRNPTQCWVMTLLYVLYKHCR